MPDMNIMHAPADLLALDALLQATSVTAAARQLGVTQSAMSHTLARLRRDLQDPLLVRSGRRLVPTARAEQMAPRLREAVQALEAAVAAPAAFDPATARRGFRIAMPDYGELVMLPPLIARLEREAPGVDLAIVRASTEALDAGEVDVVLQPRRREDDRAGVRARALFRDRFVCVLRHGHPLSEALTVERFAAARHLLIAPRGRPGGIVDEALAERGLERRTVVTAPSFLAAPYLVARSDLVLTLAERVARLVATGLPLHILSHPLELPGFTTSMIWHERMEHDPAHIWLRTVFAEEGARV